jgi:hypothetical protein
VTTACACLLAAAAAAQPLVSTPAPSSGAERPARASLGELLKRDATAILPRREDLPCIAVSLAGIAALTTVDRSLAENIHQHGPGALHRVEPLGRYAAGNVIGLALFGVGLAGGGQEWRTAGLTAIESNLLTSWLVNGLQRAAGRARPTQPDAGDWRRGGSSFPSAHAAHAASWAGVIYEAFPRWRWRWTMPVVAGAVAVSRVKDQKHFPADVVAGGLIGWWMGSRLERSHRGGSFFEVVPISGGAEVRLAFHR